jgi:peptide/nickel transport system substrate-binding protein
LRGVTASATEKHTLELTFPGPTPQIFSLFVDLPIIDPQSNVDTALGGTGPFKLDALMPGDELRMVRNEHYWRRDRPLLDTAIVKIVPDPASLLVNLESGAVHAVATVPLNEMKRVQSGPNTVGLVIPGPGNYNFLVSTVDEPFDDKRVRQAMGLAIDRKRFVDTLMFGLTDPTYIVWPKSSPVWDASLDSGEFNLDKAKALLAEAGVPNGFETKIHATRGAIPEVAQFAQIFQADLAKIGVKASIEEAEANQWLSLITESKFPALLGHSYGAADQDPALLFSAHPFGTEKNASRFQSDEYKRLVTAAQAEADWDKRISLYRDVTRLIKDEAFILPLANRVETRALRRHVQGFELDPQAHPKFENVSLA